MTKQKHVVSVFLDLKKAYSTVNHDNMLPKLNTYGVHDVALDLLRSYLSNGKHVKTAVIILIFKISQ